MRLFAKTREKIIALIGRGVGEVEAIARALGVSANAVRTHLAALERDGIIDRAGVRHGAGVGKPPTMYRLRPEVARLLSRAYVPVLNALVGELVDQFPAETVDALMRAVGRKLADEAGRVPTRDVDAGIDAATTLLESLGGAARIEQADGAATVCGTADCPLAAAVGHQPVLCTAMGALVSDVVGKPVEVCCEHGERPRCRFRVATAA